uniref:YhdP family phospholipid transporter n=1 Tax=Macromonas nakdongensis TaxID=1843082 RepID=UPI0026F432BB
DVDLDAWDGLAPAAAGTPTTAPAAAALAQDYWPTTFGLSAERIRQGGRQFHDVVAGGSREGDTWRMSVGARELNGYLEYRPSQGAAPGRVYARLARLTLPPSSVSEVDSLLQAQPRLMPALDVVVDDLELKGRRLGRLDIQAVNRSANLAAQDAGREWRLNTLNLTVPEARLQASGNWATLGGTGRNAAQRRTALKVNLAIDDAGALLARFGMPDVIRGGKGTLGGTLGWVGSPLGWDVPSLSGDLQLDLQRGQFLKADPGLAKLLGVLSLQALPRRLVLDFRDVFSEGFAFDFVRGNAQIVQGVASTNNLQMKGVSAAVLLEGSADIARETQDITAVVIPELNAGTASLVATVISPVTGLGTFLAQYLLRQPLQEAATQQYRIHGSWVDPQVEKLERPNRRNIAPEEGAAPRPGGNP